MTTYFNATRHQWACLIFLLPLLIVYEGGVIWFGGADPGSLRNGADAWLRWGLERYGLGQVWAAPVIVVVILLIRCWVRWGDRPQEPLAVAFGMMIESVIFAVGLWAVARNFEPLLTAWGIPTSNISFRNPAVGQLITYVGAGIYEEVLFRLGLFTVLYILLRVVLIPKPIALVVAGLAGAFLFAAAHHIGPHGEEVVPILFLFRTMAGLYFTTLYVTRGFGVAVGAHAAYDIIVGVAVG